MKSSALRSGAPPFGHDPAEEFGHFLPGPVTGTVRGGWQPGEKETQGVDAVLQFVIGIGKIRIHLVADLLPDQAATGDPDREFIHRVRQVDYPRLAEAIGKPGCLLEHDAGKPAHRGFPKRRIQKPQLLGHELGGDVVCHATPEDGYRKLIDILGVQLILGCPEIEVVRLRPCEKYKIPGADTEPEKFALLVPAAA